MKIEQPQSLFHQGDEKRGIKMCRSKGYDEFLAKYREDLLIKTLSTQSNSFKINLTQQAFF